MIQGEVNQVFKLNRDERGFTLVELLIVIAILGVLMAIVVPNLSGLLGRGKQQSYDADLATIQTAVDAYYLTSKPNAYPTDTGLKDSNFNFVLLTSTISGTTPMLHSAPQSVATYTWKVLASGVVSSTPAFNGNYP